MNKIENYTVCIKKDEKTNLLSASINDPTDLTLISNLPGKYSSEKEIYEAVYDYVLGFYENPINA